VLFTHADDNRVSKTFSGVCLILSVCPHDKTKTAKSTMTKLATGHRDSPLRVMVHQLILDQKVKGQGHKVQNIMKAIEWPA